MDDINAEIRIEPVITFNERLAVVMSCILK